MQTFLPYSNFIKSALTLDHYNAGKYSRCWKQVVEAKQILCTLHANELPKEWKLSKDWIYQKRINHPGVQMWKGYENWLISYYNIFLQVCKCKHKINTNLPFLNGGILTVIDYNDLDRPVIVKREIPMCKYHGINKQNKRIYDNTVAPFWLGNENFHRSHRAKLIEKCKHFYLSKFPDDEGFNNSQYLWPDLKSKTFKTIIKTNKI